MKKLLLGLMVGLIMVVFNSPTHADTVSFLPGTTYFTSELTASETYGDEMDGLKVTAFFIDGTSQEAFFVDKVSVPGAGMATGTTSWSLTEAGDTFSSIWTLTNNSDFSLTSLVIDAGAGNAVFDTQAIGDVNGTAESNRGWNFQRRSLNFFAVNATYTDQVALSGFPAVGDLFRTLTLNFSTTVGFPTGIFGTMTFVADTDSLSITGDLNPTPVPATVVLLGSGLLGLAGVSRKK